MEKQCVIGAVKPICIYKKYGFSRVVAVEADPQQFQEKKEKEKKMVTGKQILENAQENLQTCESYRDVAFVKSSCRRTRRWFQSSWKNSTPNMSTSSESKKLRTS